MGNNIFQKRVQAVTPKTLSDERIFVYVPKADNLGSVGIAAFNVTRTEDGDVLLGDFIVSNQAIVSLNPAKYYTKQEIIDIYQRLDNMETGDAPTDDATKYPSSHTIKTYVDGLNAFLTQALQDEEDARIAADNTLQTNIDNEETARIAADNTLQTNINTVQSNLNSEASTRAMADASLSGRIDAEETARINADNTLQSNIDTEASTRAQADTALDTRTSDIEDLIPEQATSQNQLADKGYVNALIAGIQGSRTYSFDTFAHFEAWLNREYTRADGLTIDNLKVGNFILLEQTDVPDYWCKSTELVDNVMTLEANFNEVEVHIDLTPYQKKLQFDVLPTPTAQLVGQIYQYIGTTNANYTNGKFYKVVYKNGQYVYAEPDYRPIIKPMIAPEENSFIYIDDDNEQQLAPLGKGLALVDGELRGGLELVE